MATQTRSCAEATSSNAFGDIPWSVPYILSPPSSCLQSAEGHIASDATNAHGPSVTPGSSTHYLLAKDFGFSIPAGATIDGITVSITRRVTNASMPGRDERIRIIKGGTVKTTDKASGSSWPDSYAVASYGSSSDLWGETWTDTDINNTGFGVALSAVSTSVKYPTYFQVDCIEITVHYTESSGSASSATMSLMGV